MSEMMLVFATWLNGGTSVLSHYDCLPESSLTNSHNWQGTKEESNLHKELTHQQLCLAVSGWYSDIALFHPDNATVVGSVVIQSCIAWTHFAKIKRMKLPSPDAWGLATLCQTISLGSGAGDTCIPMPRTGSCQGFSLGRFKAGMWHGCSRIWEINTLVKVWGNFRE